MIKIKFLCFMAFGFIMVMAGCRTTESNANLRSAQDSNIKPISASKSSTGGNVLYRESFSGISEGSRPSNWLGGSSLFVKGGKLVPVIEQKNTTRTTHQFTIKEIYFPENFEFYIRMGIADMHGPIIFEIGNLRVEIQRAIESNKMGRREVILASINGAQFVKPIASGYAKNVKLDYKEHIIFIKVEKSLASLTVNNNPVGSIAIQELNHIEGMMFRYQWPFGNQYFDIKEIVLTGEESPIQMKAKNTVYYENFRGTDIGRVPDGWIDGSTFAVQESQRFSGAQGVIGKRVLRRMKPGKESFTISNISFPPDYKLDFEMINTENFGHDFTISIGDISFKISDYECRLGETANLKNGVKFLPSSEFDRNRKRHDALGRLSEETDVSPRGIGREAFLLTLTKIENIFRLYLNSREVAFIRLSNYHPANSISYSGSDKNKTAIYSIKVTGM